MSMEKNNCCCFTGHRAIAPEHRELLEERIRLMIPWCVRRGQTTFLTGGALGFDTMAAEAVLEMKAKLPMIRLKLVLPCKDQTKNWHKADIDKYNEILAKADEVEYTAESYHRGCMLERDRRLVDESCVCISYLTKKTGGTYYTVNYAKGKGIRVVDLINK